MTFPLRACKLICLVVIIFVTMMSFSTTAEAIPSITVKVADTTAIPGYLNATITIFMDNLFDEVAAFNLWIQLEPQDLMVFKTDILTVIDTTYWVCDSLDAMLNCADSTKVDSLSPWEMQHIGELLVAVGSFDTTGTLISGWKYVQTRSISGVGTDINIVAISDFSNGSQVPPIPAGQQGGVLLRVLADIFPMDDTVTERTANLIVQTTTDHFSISRPNGTAINWMPFEYIDTLCYECTVLVGENCLEYTRIGGNFDPLLCDSMHIFLDTTSIWDSTNVVIINGSLTNLLSFVCGNLDSAPDGNVDISDLIFIVDFIFGSPKGPAPVPYEAGNVDCLGDIDISDLIFLVDFIFGSTKGPAPCTTCP